MTDVRPLRIGLYSPALPNSGVSNGIVTYTRIMRDAFRDLGHSVFVLTTNSVECSDGTVMELAKPNLLARRFRILLESRRHDGSHPAVRLRVLDAFRAARNRAIDVFEIEESFGWAASMTGKGVAIVERLHGPHVFVRDTIETAEQSKLGDLRERAEHESFGKVQAVTAPTQRLLDAMKSHGLNTAITRAIPNPMPIPSGRRWSPEEANLDQILFVGRFDLCKGADVAIRAFARAVALRPNLTLLMIGPDKGLAHTDGRVLKFDEFVAGEVPPHIRARIQFLSEQSPERIAELRLQSALALVTSRFETSSYALAEAMAVGMPVITSDCFGPAEMVKDGLNGRLVPVGDVIATGQAIVELTGNSALLARLGKSARAHVADHLSPERIATKTVEVYREAIAQLHA